MTSPSKSTEPHPAVPETGHDSRAEPVRKPNGDAGYQTPQQPVTVSDTQVEEVAERLLKEREELYRRLA